MSVIKGYDAQVDLGVIVDSDVAYRTSGWSLDVAGDTHDVTDFTSEGWREFLAGLKGWSGTIEKFVDDTNQIVPSDVGATATITLYLNSTHYLRGSAILNGWNPSVAVGDAETESLSFQGTSDLFYV